MSTSNNTCACVLIVYTVPTLWNEYGGNNVVGTIVRPTNMLASWMMPTTYVRTIIRACERPCTIFERSPRRSLVYLLQNLQLVEQLIHELAILFLPVQLEHAAASASATSGCGRTKQARIQTDERSRGHKRANRSEQQHHLTRHHFPPNWPAHRYGTQR